MTNLVLLRNSVMLMTALFALCHAGAYLQVGRIDGFTAFVGLSTGVGLSYVIHWAHLQILVFAKLDQFTDPRGATGDCQKNPFDNESDTRAHTAIDPFNRDFK